MIEQYKKFLLFINAIDKLNQIVNELDNMTFDISIEHKESYETLKKELHKHIYSLEFIYDAIDDKLRSM